MGAFSFCNSIISYLLLLAALGVSTYAVREGQAVREDKEKLTQFVSEVYTITMIMTLLSYLILAVLLVFWHKLGAYREIVMLLSTSVIMTTIGADWVNTLLEDFLYITLRYIGVQTFCLLMLILLVKQPSDLYIYTLIIAVSSVGGNLVNVWYIRRRIRFHLTKEINFSRHIRPMLTLFSNDLAIKIYLIADITILGILMTEKDVGYYTLSSKVYTAVKEMINAMILVTVPRFSYYLSHGLPDKYNMSFKAVCNGVVTLMLPCIVGLIFQAENIAYFLGGQDYINSTESLQILSLALLFSVGANIVSKAVLIPNKLEKYYLAATVTAAITNVIFNLLLIPVLGIAAAALTTLASEAIVFSIMFYYCRPVCPTYDIRESDVLSAAIGTVGIALICIACNTFLNTRSINMIVSICGSVIAYGAIICVMRNHTAMYFIKSLTGKK